MWRAFHVHFREPLPDRPSRPSAADVAFALGGMGLAVVEGLTRDGLPLRAVEIAFGVGMAATLMWRRSHPLPALIAAFACADALTALQIARHLPELGLHSGVLILVHPYSLVRRGSGREVAIGLFFVVSAYVMNAFAGTMHDLKDAIGALVALLFPAVLGAVVRLRESGHHREVQHAQLKERQLLARELHDTVAHHVSAIVIQAQGARAIAATRPDAALAALLAIEGEASRSLRELRALVGALREDEAAARKPSATVSEIEELVREAGEGASFTRTGDVLDLPPEVALALHRIARESLHNARKHARQATRIEVRLVGGRDSVRLTVRDDGQGPRTGPRAQAGFGLVGMKERATLLGGTLEAGPLPDGGWQVEVVLPRDGTGG